MKYNDAELTCPVCLSTAQRGPVKQLSDRRKGLAGLWLIFRCPNCRVFYLNPTPTDSELSDFYSHYYEGIVSDSGDPPSSGSRFGRLRRIYHLFSGDVDPRDFIPVPAKHTRMLDLGSGGGTYLSYFHNLGANITGADVSASIVDSCRRAGMSVRQLESFDTIPFMDGDFDIVYLMQVFEHLRSPRDAMRELSRILSPGGTLYIALPNAASVWRRVFGSNWVSGWFVPFHLVHYTREALVQLGADFGLHCEKAWSRTPESWFRLNLKATLKRNENKLDSRRWLVDAKPARLIIGLLLRAVDQFVRERDCLVVEFTKAESRAIER